LRNVRLKRTLANRSNPNRRLQFFAHFCECGYWHKADIGLRGVNVGSGGKAAIGADSPYRIAGLTSAVYCRVCVALQILRSVSLGHNFFV